MLELLKMGNRHWEMTCGKFPCSSGHRHNIIIYKIPVFIIIIIIKDF